MSSQLDRNLESCKDEAESIALEEQNVGFGPSDESNDVQNPLILTPEKQAGFREMKVVLNY